jgi:hypothetical protein
MGNRVAKQEKKKTEAPTKEAEMRPGESKLSDKVTAPMIASVTSLIEKEKCQLKEKSMLLHNRKSIFAIFEEKKFTGTAST